MAQEPLRVVEFTTTFYLGGTEVQAVELLRGLQSRHLELEVATLVEVGPLLESVRRLGHVPATFPLGGSGKRLNTALQIGKLARWLRQRRISLVHAHDFYTTLLAVPAAKLAGCRVVVGRLDLAHWYGPGRRALLAQLTRWADQVVVNAATIRQMLIRKEHVLPERIAVIPNGLDLSRFDERIQAGLLSSVPDTGGAPVVVHVANMLHPVKRQEDLISAMALLRRDKTRLHAFLVGDGPRRPALAELVRRLGVEDRVHFLGHRLDVPAIYAYATLGVLCSSAEGLPNAVMEGMAAGLPVVATGVGGVPDLIADGERGLLVRPGQPAELASAFVRLLADRQAAHQMGERARAFVERELTLQRMVAAHEAMYRRVLAEPVRR